MPHYSAPVDNRCPTCEVIRPANFFVRTSKQCYACRSPEAWAQSVQDLHDFQQLISRPHPTMEGLFATEDGQLWRDGYVTVTGCYRPFRRLHQNPITNGYLSVSIRNHNYLAHTLVAQCWLGEKPGEEFEIDHADGDRTNNSPLNLRWLTREENYRAARRRQGDWLAEYRGGHPAGRRSLEFADAVLIRQRYECDGDSIYAIAKDYPQVSETTIRKIATRQSYRHDFPRNPPADRAGDSQSSHGPMTSGAFLAVPSSACS